MNKINVAGTKFDQEKVIAILIGAFLLLTYIFGLFVPVTSDAGKYAAISRVIYETGDWINISVHYEPYLQKPPLLFWITTPFYFLVGPSEVAFKLPVLLYSVIAIYSVFKFARIFYSKRVAQLAALMLATSEFYFLFHNDIHTDVLLTANVIFAIWHIAEYFKSYKLQNMLLAGLGIGLGMISKGPIGVFVPVTATLVHLIFTKQLKRILNYKIVLGGAVCLVVLAVGMVGLVKQFGWEGLEFFFWENNAGRIAGRIKGGKVDYLFYFHTTLYVFLPWGILFFLAAFFEVKELFKKGNAELFSLGGIVFYWSIISVAHAQAPHYLMVLSPFMAVLAAKWMVRFFENAELYRMRKAVVIIQYVSIVLMWILVLVLSGYCFQSKSFWFWGGIAILLVLLFLPLQNNQIALVVRRSIISIIAISFAINTHVFPELFHYQSVIAACEVYEKQARDGEMLNTYKSQHRELFFYAKTPGYYLYDSDDLEQCLKNQPGGWIYTNDEGLEEIQQSGTAFQLVQSFKHRSLSGFTAKFINPATRESSLKNMHLVKILK
ncbi:glycosyltransferase family 39 protein [Prolixibacteraceae bacterium Z1-6]|uniref:Glycosyltransferase family 39 protein n=1 Tax=Draconibacterium aestuarii TaxID=2998507 RepID=A0A9X3F4R7_9BACT|nr:glycosyltransferase family 39 protein [Prolixibacteraceae bacterium Z1-6]